MAKPESDSLFLLTDLYQLTMACGYWKCGKAEQEAAFYLTFRRNPFGGQFTVACGLAPVLDFLREFHLSESDRNYLETLAGADGKPLFDTAFLDDLAKRQLTCDIDAVPEGTVVFPQEPLVRVKGPLLEAQLLETVLLNIINFQSLIATKAARICMAARGNRVLEFGLRRAHGINGALSASRAAYVGGCHATSNVLAGKLYGIPVAGTHAHSWVMSFDSEQESFQAYAQAMPNNSIFLVDTYDTAAGIANAIRAGRWLREHGHEMLGVRLDSGDLASLSVDARRLLDEAGFREAKIVASGDLDEHSIAGLYDRGAPIAILGVGTKLATGYDDPALGGVYKLSAIRDEEGVWQPKLKTSNDPAKASNPGSLQTRRFTQDGNFLRDVIYDELEPPANDWAMADPSHSGGAESVTAKAEGEDLLVPVLRGGEPVYAPPSIEESRQRTYDQLACLPPETRKFKNPRPYRVGLEQGLHERKAKLIENILNR
jgi:nicotinate phosphoribosyltransferase